MKLEDFAKAPAPNSFQNNPDGSREFTCTGCGMRVLEAVPIFDFPVCGICRFFDERPQIPPEVKARLKGGAA